MANEINNTPPTVSVVMITYGHEAFIKQAVEGVLMQECNFPVELIVADDCSPDATPQVMEEILRTHPRASWIRYTRHPKNKGMMPNFVWALEQARGKYIALCEGDDYWTDPYKLQKQVGILEAGPYLGGCTHNHEVLNLTDRKLPENAYSEFEASPSYIIRNDLFFQTASLVFRNEVLVQTPFLKEFKIRSGDVFLSNLIALFGPIYHLEQKMSCYRYHPGGVSQVNEKSYLKWIFNDIRMYERLDKKSMFKHHHDFKFRIEKMQELILKRIISPQFFGRGKIRQSIRIIFKLKIIGINNTWSALLILLKL